MYVPNKTNPPGCTPLRDEDRMPVCKVISGDTWVVSATFTAADGGPASPRNSFVEFVLSENQFSPPIWTGEWFSGIIPDENRPGLVHINIPRDVTKTLRRGSYMFSARVADKTKFYFDTQLKGYFLVEYEPTSDQHSIPYRDGTSEIFISPNSPDEENAEAESGSIVLRDVVTDKPYLLGVAEERLFLDEGADPAGVRTAASGHAGKKGD